jgi:hypothetical protein
MNGKPDVTLKVCEQWPGLASDHGFPAIVDPAVYRFGELFLMGAEGPPTKLANDPRWQTIAKRHKCVSHVL